MKNLKEFKFDKYYGMDNTTAPYSLRGYQAVEIMNFLVRSVGKLTRVEGATTVGTATGTDRILGLSHFSDSGTNFQVRVKNTSIQSLSGVTWSDMTGGTGLTASLDMNFCWADGALYGFNGTDVVKKVGSASVSDIAGIPEGKWAVWFRNYLFVGGVTAYPNRIYFSNLGDPETFTADDYIDIEPGDGDSLTGAISNSPDKLIITKNYSVHYLTGAGTNTFAVYPVTRDFGTPSYRSLVVVGNDIWCISTEGRIMSILRNQYGLMGGKDISSKWLQGTIDDINKAQLAGVCSAQINGYVLFAVPTGASTTNNLILVGDSQAPFDTDTYSMWTLMDGKTPSCFDVYSPDGTDMLYWGDDTAHTKVFKWDGTTNDGTAISAYWIGPELELEGLGQRKRFRQLKIWGYPLGNYDVNVLTSLDNNIFTNIGTLNLSTGGTWDNTDTWDTGEVWGSLGDIWERLHFSNNDGKVNGFKTQVKMTYSASSEVATIGAHSIYYSVLR